MPTFSQRAKETSVPQLLSFIVHNSENEQTIVICYGRMTLSGKNTAAPQPFCHKDFNRLCEKVFFNIPKTSFKIKYAYMEKRKK
jgi:hypothetical protein